MKYKVNDKGCMICYNCRTIVPITYLLRDIQFNDNSGTAKEILVGVCDNCDSVVTTPKQSANNIKEQYNNTKRST